MAGTALIEVSPTHTGSSDGLDSSSFGLSTMAPDPILDLVARISPLAGRAPTPAREPAAGAGRSVLSSSSGSWSGEVSEDGERPEAPPASPPPRRRWPFALLAAYAVAATIACAWLFWSGRR